MLSVLASFFLIGVHCITSIFVKEKVLVAVMCVFSMSRIGYVLIPRRNEKRGFIKEIKTLYQNTLTLPRVILQIVSRYPLMLDVRSSQPRIQCIIQFL